MRQNVMNKGVVAFLALGIAICGALAWNLFQRASALSSDVEVVERTGEEISHALEEINTQAEQSLDEIEAAEALAGDAQSEAEQELRQASQAAQDRAAADAARNRAVEAAGTAQNAREAAQQSAAEHRRQRRDEWQRLGAALRKIAPTTSGDWSYAVSLDRLEIDGEQNLRRDSREMLSRLAGILLANYGYSATLVGSDAVAVAEYLEEAGVPRAALAIGGGTGGVVVTLEDTILD